MSGTRIYASERGREHRAEQRLVMPFEPRCRYVRRVADDEREASAPCRRELANSLSKEEVIENDVRVEKAARKRARRELLHRFPQRREGERASLRIDVDAVQVACGERQERAARGASKRRVPGSQGRASEDLT